MNRIWILNIPISISKYKNEQQPILQPELLIETRKIVLDVKGDETLGVAILDDGMFSFPLRSVFQMQQKSKSEIQIICGQNVTIFPNHFEISAKTGLSQTSLGNQSISQMDFFSGNKILLLESDKVLASPMAEVPLLRHSFYSSPSIFSMYSENSHIVHQDCNKEAEQEDLNLSFLQDASYNESRDITYGSVPKSKTNDQLCAQQGTSTQIPKHKALKLAQINESSAIDRNSKEMYPATSSRRKNRELKSEIEHSKTETWPWILQSSLPRSMSCHVQKSSHRIGSLCDELQLYEESTSFPNDSQLFHPQIKCASLTADPPDNTKSAMQLPHSSEQEPKSNNGQNHLEQEEEIADVKNAYSSKSDSKSEYLKGTDSSFSWWGCAPVLSLTDDRAINNDGDSESILRFFRVKKSRDKTKEMIGETKVDKRVQDTRKLRSNVCSSIVFNNLLEITDFVNPFLGPIQKRGIRKVSCGKEHCVALCLYAKVYSWGASSHGQLGHTDRAAKLHPTLVSSLRHCTTAQIECSEYATECLTSQGVVFTWGWRPGYPNKLWTPTLCSQIGEISCEYDKFESISSGRKLVVALTSSGKVWVRSSMAVSPFPLSTEAMLACLLFFPLNVHIEELKNSRVLVAAAGDNSICLVSEENKLLVASKLMMRDNSIKEAQEMCSVSYSGEKSNENIEFITLALSNTGDAAKKYESLSRLQRSPSIGSMNSLLLQKYEWIPHNWYRSSLPSDSFILTVKYCKNQDTLIIVTDQRPSQSGVQCNRDNKAPEIGSVTNREWQQALGERDSCNNFDVSKHNVETNFMPNSKRNADLPILHVFQEEPDTDCNLYNVMTSKKGDVIRSWKHSSTYKELSSNHDISPIFTGRDSSDSEIDELIPDEARYEISRSPQKCQAKMLDNQDRYNWSYCEASFFDRSYHNNETDYSGFPSRQRDHTEELGKLMWIEGIYSEESKSNHAFRPSRLKYPLNMTSVDTESQYSACFPENSIHEFRIRQHSCNESIESNHDIYTETTLPKELSGNASSWPIPRTIHTWDSLSSAEFGSDNTDNCILLFPNSLSSSVTQNSEHEPILSQKDKEMTVLSQQWLQIIQQWSSSKATDKLNKLKWKGIPSHQRHEIWKLAIGNRFCINPELFAILKNKAKHREEKRIQRMQIQKARVVDRIAKRLNCDSNAEATQKCSHLYEKFESKVSESIEKTLVETCALEDCELDSRDSPPLGRAITADDVELDLLRTFPQLAFFRKDGPFYTQLREILQAYCFFRPDVGYVQGMSFLAAVLLLHMNQYDAFCCFSNLVNHRCLMSFYRMDLSSMIRRFEIFSQVLQATQPDLFRHMLDLEIHADLYIIEWYMTLFSKALPLDTLARLWDVILLNNSENYGLELEMMLFRVSIAIIQACSGEILQCYTLADCMVQLQKSISQLQAETLLPLIKSCTIPDTIKQKLIELNK